MLARIPMRNIIIAGIFFFAMFLSGIALATYERISSNLNAVETNNRITARLICSSLAQKKYPTKKFKPFQAEHITKYDKTYIVKFHYETEYTQEVVECWAGKVGDDWVSQLKP